MPPTIGVRHPLCHADRSPNLSHNSDVWLTTRPSCRDNVSTVPGDLWSDTDRPFYLRSRGEGPWSRYSSRQELWNRPGLPLKLTLVTLRRAQLQRRTLSLRCSITIWRTSPHKNWMDLRVGYRLKDGRADDSFMKTIQYESGKLQLNAFNQPDYFSNRKEIITIQFTSADNARANPWVHGSDPL